MLPFLFMALRHETLQQFRILFGQAFNRAKIVDHDGAVRAKGKIAGVGIAVDRPELKDLLADGIEKAFAQLVTGGLVEAVRIVHLVQCGAGFAAQGQHLLAGEGRKT